MTATDPKQKFRVQEAQALSVLGKPCITRSE